MTTVPQMVALLDEALHDIPEATDAHKRVREVRTALMISNNERRQALQALSDVISGQIGRRGRLLKPDDDYPAGTGPYGF